MPEPFYTYDQASRYKSPRPMSERLVCLFWLFIWRICCAWTPKFFYPWRNFILRLFGATVEPGCFVHSTVKISVPWNLIMREQSCIGELAVVYNLAPIEMGARSIVAQESYLCTASHDFEKPEIPLIVAKISIGAEVFIGARSFILPGTIIGRHAIIGAGSVVTKDIPESEIWAGNPCKLIRKRNQIS